MKTFSSISFQFYTKSTLTRTVSTVLERSENVSVLYENTTLTHVLDISQISTPRVRVRSSSSTWRAEGRTRTNGSRTTAEERRVTSLARRYCDERERERNGERGAPRDRECIRCPSSKVFALSRRPVDANSDYATDTFSFRGRIWKRRD